MTTYLLAGGGTAGHVNPLLAVADALAARNPQDQVIVLGTASGLESRLVPERGHELVVIPRVPFPRRPNVDALAFPVRFRRAVRQVERLLIDRAVDVVVGFGGYVAPPAYRAARRRLLPVVVHEANARPGLANRMGARTAAGVGVAFDGTRLPHARLVGLPLRRELATLDRVALRAEAAAFFGLDPQRRTLLVTGGSTGARNLNRQLIAAARELTATGWQVLHALGKHAGAEDPDVPGYRVVDYLDRMDFAYALADAAVSRAGAATVSEQCALGIPAVYVPYAVGNGEQRRNAAGVIAAGGGLFVADAAFTTERVRDEVIPWLTDAERLTQMADAARSVGLRDGTERMLALIDEAAGEAVPAAARDHAGR